jgi:centromeric protein E
MIPSFCFPTNRVGYIEIYNEKVIDLLDPKSNDLKIQEGAQGEIFMQQKVVTNLYFNLISCIQFYFFKECILNCEADIINNFEIGNKQKRMEETKMNERSSRSHAIFRITLESYDTADQDIEEKAVQISHLNLVDLAGSEKPDQNAADTTRYKEGISINKSLLSLGIVINKLSEMTETTFVNYRDSKLTRILQQSLGGNALSVIICTVTPAVLDETYSTLK